MYAGVPMKEFLMWSNCSNNCAFCWQKKLNKSETLLTEAEKIEAIDAVISEINTLEYTDILIVGGEVYCPHSASVNTKLAELFNLIATRIRNGQTRYMYANTNLIYSDFVNMDALLTAFSGMNDKLRLTTSYDLAGRFKDEYDRALFLFNLKRLYKDYGVNPCVNIILTDPLCDAVINNTFDISDFCKEYHLAFVNPIPYIPVSQDDPLRTTWEKIKTVIIKTEYKEPHFTQFYIDQMNMEVDRILKEYRKGTGFVRCDSTTASCGHNVNYSRVFSDGECYVCKLKAEFDFPPVSDQDVQDMFDANKVIITVGDYCTDYIWTKFGQPNMMFIDGKDSANLYSDALKKVRAAGYERIMARHIPEYPEGSELDRVGRAHLPNLTTDDHLVIQVVGEEDDALYTCIRYAPSGAAVFFGDGISKCMRCKQIAPREILNKELFEAQ